MNGTMVAVEKKPREIWVEFGSNPSPLLHSFATIVPVFLYASFYLLNGEWGEGGGGNDMKRRKKKLHSLLDKKILILPHFCSLLLSL